MGSSYIHLVRTPESRTSRRVSPGSGVSPPTGRTRHSGHPQNRHAMATRAASLGIWALPIHLGTARPVDGKYARHTHLPAPPIHTEPVDNLPIHEIGHSGLVVLCRKKPDDFSDKSDDFRYFSGRIGHPFLAASDSSDFSRSPLSPFRPFSESVQSGHSGLVGRSRAFSMS
jgi:hypothetical protein